MKEFDFPFPTKQPQSVNDAEEVHYTRLIAKLDNSFDVLFTGTIGQEFKLVPENIVTVEYKNV